jgi:hypothetical protein
VTRVVVRVVLTAATVAAGTAAWWVGRRVGADLAAQEPKPAEHHPQARRQAPGEVTGLIEDAIEIRSPGSILPR